jgi:hypothetical protein
MDDEQQRTRALDAFASTPADKLSATELGELLEAAAQRGAITALKTVGLDDKDAFKDMREIRDNLNSYRRARKLVKGGAISFFKQTFSIGSKLVSTAFFIYLLAKLGLNEKQLKAASEIIGLN